MTISIITFEVCLEVLLEIHQTASTYAPHSVNSMLFKKTILDEMVLLRFFQLFDIIALFLDDFLLAYQLVLKSLFVSC